jgi:hypothetical protein
MPDRKLEEDEKKSAPSNEPDKDLIGGPALPVGGIELY